MVIKQIRRWLDSLKDRWLFAVDRFPALTIFGLFVAGILFWGAFNTSMEVTNTMDFCISCHEMRDNVYPEYKASIHYKNTTGVRASCPDCHVPRQWVYKFVRKINATNELYHTLIGSIDTPEKFKKKRPQLAQLVWKTMRDSDSRECRNCHNMDYMDISKQLPRAAIFHEYGSEQGITCIDCHKGIAHHLPDNYTDQAFEEILDAIHLAFEERDTKCYLCHEEMMHSDWGDETE